MKLDPVELTRRLVAVDTANPPGRERALALILQELLSGAGFKVQMQAYADDRDSLAAVPARAAGEPLLAFCGHLDTVPLGSERWTRDPFGGETDGDKLYGRGSSDMKGGLAPMVTAAVRLAAETERRAPIILLFTADEETGSRGAADLVPLVRDLGRVGAMVVAEPTANHPLIAHKGVLWLRAEARGRAAHGSQPELGDNAVYKAAEAVGILRGLDFELDEDPVLGGPTLSVGTFSGGTKINIVPDRAVMEIDIRTTPSLSAGHLLERLRREFAGRLDFTAILDLPPLLTDPDDPWVAQVFDTLTPLLGFRPGPKGVNYFTDAAVLTPALGRPPTVILGPGQPEMAHRVDEYCSVSRIRQAEEAYYLIGRNWLKNQPKTFGRNKGEAHS